MKQTNMKTYFKTNLDWYTQLEFPVFENIVPHKGEMVCVMNKYLGFCIANKIPFQLEVVAVTYSEERVICELWYRKIDTEAASLSKNGLSHLYKQ